MFDRHPLRCDRIIFMSEEDAEDISNADICEYCGGWYDKRFVEQHPGPGCDLRKVRDIIES